MRVYKLFMKLLVKHKSMLIMYTAIFLAITFLVSSQGSKNNETKFENKSVKMAVFDNDESALSKAFVKYLKSENKFVKIDDDKKSTIKDELYDRNVECVVKIPEGFGEAAYEGKEDLLEIFSIPNTVSSSLITRKINSYLKVYSSYIDAGYSVDDAIEKTEKIQKMKADTQILNTKSKDGYSKVYYFYIYVSYTVVVMFIIVIGRIMCVLNRKEIRAKISSSSYGFVSYNKEVLLGMITTGVLVGIAYVVFSVVLCGNDVFTAEGLLYIAQMFCFVFVALSLAYLISVIITKQNALDMFANILGLGGSFLCGIFVPVEVMSEKVIQASQFWPVYWYGKGCRIIDNISFNKDYEQLFTCFAIELLFGVVFLLVGIATARVFRKR